MNELLYGPFANNPAGFFAIDAFVEKRQFPHALGRLQELAGLALDTTPEKGGVFQEDIELMRLYVGGVTEFFGWLDSVRKDPVNAGRFQGQTGNQLMLSVLGQALVQGRGTIPQVPVQAQPQAAPVPARPASIGIIVPVPVLDQVRDMLLTVMLSFTAGGGTRDEPGNIMFLQQQVERMLKDTDIGVIEALRIRQLLERLEKTVMPADIPVLIAASNIELEEDEVRDNLELLKEILQGLVQGRTDPPRLAASQRSRSAPRVKRDKGKQPARIPIPPPPPPLPGNLPNPVVVGSALANQAEEALNTVAANVGGPAGAPAGIGNLLAQIRQTGQNNLKKMADNAGVPAQAPAQDTGDNLMAALQRRLAQVRDAATGSDSGNDFE